MVQVCPDPETLSQAAADLFVQTAREAVAARDRFVVALSGGGSPRRTYQLLAETPYREEVPWGQTNVFWGDERCVPKEDPRNNARMAFDELLSHVAIPESQIHPIASEQLPGEAADNYEALLRSFFDRELPRFDLIFLGLGEDGHTASLFPKSPVLKEPRRWVKELYVPEQKLHRVTLTATIINQSARIVFLVYGRNKSRILQEVLAGPPHPQLLPAQLIRPEDGDLLWLVDEAAAQFLPQRDSGVD